MDTARLVPAAPVVAFAADAGLADDAEAPFVAGLGFLVSHGTGGDSLAGDVLVLVEELHVACKVW